MAIKLVTEPILEVIAVSVSDAIAARNGGANRLEVVRDLEYGGLTPSSEVVVAIKREVDLPLRVMLRESVGYHANSEAEIEGLCASAEQFARLGVDGVAGATFARARRNLMKFSSLARFDDQFPTKARPVSPLKPWQP